MVLGGQDTGDPIPVVIAGRRGRPGRDRRQGGAIGRETEPEDRAVRDGGADPQGPAQGLDTGAAQGQTQPRPARVASGGQLFERLKDALARLRGDAGPLIMDLELQVDPSFGSGQGARQDPDHAAGCQLQGVGQIVDQNLLDAGLVGQDDEILRQALKLDLEGQAQFVDARAPHPGDGVDSLADVDGGETEIGVSGFDPRDVEGAVEQTQQHAAGVGHVVDHGGLGPGRPRSTSVRPRMTLSGVRTSWLIMARKRDLAWLARSAVA